jgi:hypothetical protein
MIDAFSGTYIIRLDIDEWGTDLLSATRMAVDQGVPAIYAIGSDGKGTGPDITAAFPGPWSPESAAPYFKKFFSQHLRP